MNRPPGQRHAAAKTHRVSPLLVALLCFSAGAVHALGIGRLPSSAVLGQPLDLSIPIRLEDGEVLNIDCASAEVFFGDIRQQPGVVNLALEPAAPNATERTLRLLTNTRIDEPFVTVELALGCQSRTARRFTLFADPPLFSAPAAVPVAAPFVAPPAAPSTAAAPASVPARRTAATTSRGSVASMPPTRPAKRVAVAPSSGPRLQLTPLERGAAVPSRAAEPVAPLIGAAAAAQQLAADAAAAEAAASAASAVALAERDRARVEQLEASLQALRTETAQTQQAMRGVLTRMQAAEADRYSNPLVFALLAACGLLLMALAWLWRLRAQDREAAAWQRTAGTGRKDVDTAEAIAFEQASMPTPAEPATRGAAGSVASGVAGAAFNGESTQALPRAPQMPVSAAPSVLALQAGEPARRAVSAEELIDLEQQAEFFIVLGQEEAAIDLLMGHLRSSSGSSPLPYLKLLELYRKRGNRRDYERVRESFNVRFSAYAPAWELDLNAGRTLEDYPSVIGRLQALWPTPTRALEVLQLTLARPEGDPHAGDSFELPAYRELMLLYSVARELADEEPVDTSIVDLLLPLDGDVESISLDWTASVVERLTATAAVPPQPGVRQALHVDLPLDLPPPSAAESAAGPVAFRSTTIDESADDGSPSEAGRRR